MSVVRTWRFEIVAIRGDKQDVLDRWKESAHSVSEMCNFIYMHWQQWHFRGGTISKLLERSEQCRQIIRDNRGLDESERDPLPKSESIEYWPKEFSSFIDKELKKRFPRVPSRVKTLVSNSIRKKLRGSSTKNAKLKKWFAILTHQEQLPTAKRDQPIPFDTLICTKGTPFTPVPGKQNFAMSLGLYAEPAKQGMKNAKNVYDSFEIKARKGSYAVIKKICDGEYEFMGSSVQWDENNGKWFVHVCFSRPPKFSDELNPEKVAVIRADRDRPFVLDLGDRQIPIGGDGKVVETQRYRSRINIVSRGHLYNYAPTPSRKGHGRKRAIKAQFGFGQRFQRFANHYNREQARRVAVILRENGYGTLVVELPPKGDRSDLFLCKAGNIDNNPERSGWTFDDFVRRLNEYGADFKFSVKEREVRVDNKAREESTKSTKGSA